MHQYRLSVIKVSRKKNTVKQQLNKNFLPELKTAIMTEKSRD